MPCVVRMRFRLYTLPLMLGISFVSFAETVDVDGNWTVKYVGGPVMKTIGGAEFEFKADGDKLTGIANVGMGWPGKAPISNGKIDGDRISFMVYGKQWSSSGYPKMHFVGTIHDDEIKLTMSLFYDHEQDGIAGTEFEGARGPKIAGTWEGVLKFPSQTLRIVLHISGDDNDLKATHDSPDQDVWGGKVDSIALAGRVVTFSIRPLDVGFIGDLMPDGTVVGTFKQHGTGIPLVLARSAGVARILPDTTSSVTDGRYHNNWTGIEFTIPEKFTVVETETRSNPGGMQADLAIAGIKNGRVAVWMNKWRLRPENIPTSLTVQIPAKIQRRGGSAAGYTIPQKDIQQLQIGGQQAIRATAYYLGQGMKMVELLAWISTEHSIAHFYAMMPADQVDLLKPAFDQMVMSAQVP